MIVFWNLKVKHNETGLIYYQYGLSRYLCDWLIEYRRHKDVFTVICVNPLDTTFDTLQKCITREVIIDRMSLEDILKRQERKDEGTCRNCKWQGECPFGGYCTRAYYHKFYSDKIKKAIDYFELR